jgi:hypothetical protein
MEPPRDGKTVAHSKFGITQHSVSSGFHWSEEDFAPTTSSLVCNQAEQIPASEPKNGQSTVKHTSTQTEEGEDDELVEGEEFLV